MTSTLHARMTTTMIRSALFALACASPWALPEARAVADPAADFRSMKYGFFVHYVWGGDAYSATVNRDGSKPAGLDDLANRFDAEGFARDMQAMNVEYVLFTAWHADMNMLYPSTVMEKWRPGHSAKRDLIGDMIKACKAKGVGVLLYTHPRDGHDFSDDDMARTGWRRGQGSNPDFDTWDRAKWNDFINESYAELVARYGNDILGLYLDEGSGAADSERVIDYPRLRRTITGKHPHLLMMQNDYGNLYTADLGNKEIFYHNGFDTPDGDQWPSYKIPISVVVGSIFWAAFPEGKTEPAQKSEKVGFNKWIPYAPEAMYRYTVLQAGSNTDGGGTLWAAGPYAGGGWESGVLERMRETGRLIKPVERAIKKTYPSLSYRTAPGTRIADLAWGVATRSTDDRIEYLHVLKPPASGAPTLKLPPPADGRKFSKAVLLENSKPVSLRQDVEGLTLTLPAGSSWNRINTIIALQVAPDSSRPDTALWKGTRASSHTGNREHPAMATDGDPNTSWTSGTQDGGPWLALDLGESRAIEGMELQGNFMAGDRVVGSQDFDFSRSETMATFHGSTAPALEILSATYGAGEHRADVTEKLRQSVMQDSLRVTVGNSLAGGDPAPYQPKELRVEYKVGGEQATKVVKEDQILAIGDGGAWRIHPDAKPSFRHLRIERPALGKPMQVAEWRVSTTF
jgi:Alpha-L-fucosidase/F5/8 type C domain